MKRNAISLLVAVVSISMPALATWTPPVLVTEVNIQTGEDWSPFLSFDGLTLYFSRVRTNTFTYGRIYKATRSQPFGPFTEVEEISQLNRPQAHVLAPWVSPDNLRMYYHTEKTRVGWQIWLSKRVSTNEPWPQGTILSELNQFGAYVQVPRLTPDELTIFFNANNMTGGKGGQDLWMATRPDRNSPFAQITNLEEINTISHEVSPFASLDTLELYFASSRNGDMQLFKATRNSVNDLFDNIEHLTLYNMPGGHSNFPALSSDGSTLYFMGQSGGQSTRDIYVSYIPEPATILLLGLGVVILRKKRPKHAD